MCTGLCLLTSKTCLWFLCLFEQRSNLDSATSLTLLGPWLSKGSMWWCLLYRSGAETCHCLFADPRVWRQPVWRSFTCRESCPPQHSCPKSESSLFGWGNCRPSTFRWPIWLLSFGCICCALPCYSVQGKYLSHGQNDLCLIVPVVPIV
jgi:hypothetical protein